MLANVELEKLKWNEEKRYWEGTGEVVLGEADSLESALDIKLDDKMLVYASTGKVEGKDFDVYEGSDVNDLYRIKRRLEHGEDIMEKVELVMVKASDMDQEVFEIAGNKVFGGVLTKDDMGTIITLGNGKVLGTYGDYEVNGKVVAVWAPDDEGDDNYIVINKEVSSAGVVNERMLREGNIRTNCGGLEHFRLGFKLKGEMTDEVPLIMTLLSDGLYIVNPEFKLSDDAELILTEDEYYERFIYTETAVLDTRNRTVTFFNGDGWEYVVGFDDVVGTAAVAFKNKMIQVILVTKYTWNR